MASARVSPHTTPAPTSGLSGLSLLSLSLAAASAEPIALSPGLPHQQLEREPAIAVYDDEDADIDIDDNESSNAGAPGNGGAHKRLPPHALIHKTRRLSSASQSRRRFSDARDAAARPSAAALQAAASAMTAMTLSGSPRATVSSSLPDFDVAAVGSPSLPADDTVSKKGGGGGRRRGTLFTCESCSKVYRHPSCLIKHRWEHTPHWREASRLMLSKHQQVQLMEAAAILSHLSPSATGSSSLPDDRSLWPSFLSGGALPGAQPIPAPSRSSYQSRDRHIHHPHDDQRRGYPKASSVPAKMARAGSAGPRLHDYAVPVSTAATQLRPGVLAVSTPAEMEDVSVRVMAPYAEPLRVGGSTGSDGRSGSERGEGEGVGEEEFRSGAGGTHRYPPRYGSAGDEPWSASFGTNASSVGTGLSSVGTGLSSFASVGTPSSAEDEFVDVDMAHYRHHHRGGVFGGEDYSDHSESVVKEEAEEWDGMDMEMEM